MEEHTQKFIKRSHYSHDDMTANPSKYPQGKFEAKPCRWCKEVFEPQAPSHLYCCDVCKNKGITTNYFNKKYGIGLKDVEAMLEAQGNLCAICHKEGFKMHQGVFMNLNVDHCHKTGAVRGLLCHNCNRGLGLFQDDVNVLFNAISYLTEKE